MGTTGPLNMADGVFNIAKGRINEYQARVASDDPGTSAIVVVLLKVAESDSVLEDYANLSALLAGGNTEADFANYGRKLLTDVPAPTVNNTDDTQISTIPTQIWVLAGAQIGATTKLLVCYSPSGGADSTIIPLTHQDFVADTNGGDMSAQMSANGYYRSSPPSPQENWQSLMPQIEDLGQTTGGKDRTLLLYAGSGDREEIGLFTEWQSEYLSSGRDEALILSQADDLLGYPWFDYNLMTNPIWNGGSYGLSFSHTPNAFFLPYLITGDTKYIPPMEGQFQILQEFPYWNRGDPIPPLVADEMYWTTGRMFAWQLRNLVQLAYLEQRGVTTRNIYIESLELTRQAALTRMTNDIEAEFHVLGEQQLGGDTASPHFTGWMESFIGMVVNYAINLGFTEWQGIAEWHFEHLLNRSGDRWPIKAVDNDHVSGFPATNATWENTPPYNTTRMPCYTAAPDDELMPLSLQCSGNFMTYADRVRMAKSWAAMAAENNITGATARYTQLDDLINATRSTSENYYKYSILTQRSNGDPNDLINTSPGQFTEIPNTNYGDVLPPESFLQPIRQTVGPGAITGAWSGGTYDSLRNRLMIFGGGHADYWGNDWPAFDADSLTWTLIHGPSDLTGYDNLSGQTPDGKPASRHTYFGLVYLPGTDRMLIKGGSLGNGAGVADDRWWTGDPATGNWTKLGGTGAFASLGSALAYNSSTSLTYEFLRGSLFRYDVTQFTPISVQADNGKPHMSAAIDPTRNTLLAAGEGRGYTFDLNTGTRTIRPSIRDSAYAAVNGPGLQYVPGIDRFVGWSGGNTIHLIHPTTWAITTVSGAGNTPTFTTNGVYGRFQYVSSLDGFFIVTDIGANVFFVKTPELV